MIRRVEALGYRSLRHVRQELGNFQVLVGPNASGKTTFLEVVDLIGELLDSGLAAIRARSPNFMNLVWMENPSARFELAVELEIPRERWERLPQNGFGRARYELAVGLATKGDLAILGETLWLKPAPRSQRAEQRELFPAPPEPVQHLMRHEGSHTPSGWKKVVAKKADSGIDYFFSETTGWKNPFRLGPQKAALANLPEDEERFPIATWVKRFLREGVQSLVLNSEAMRRPAPPGSPTEFQPDGSNLPWVVEDLRRQGKAFDRWVEHVRTALPDVETIDTVEREEDRHRYLRVVYKTGLRAPSWTVSDGTLRLLALTLLGYLGGEERIYLVEEPENGIHPQAVETVFQSLSSAHGRQILCATHSPVFLSLAKPEDVLCFARTEEGATDIVRGSEHPNLRHWKRSTDLGTLFATGILG